jgi:hypothetical protein
MKQVMEVLALARVDARKELRAVAGMAQEFAAVERASRRAINDLVVDFAADVAENDYRVLAMVDGFGRRIA